MKIGFTGTMSVGKTTLVKALADTPEFVDYEVRTERSKYLRDLGIPLNTDSTIKGQIVFMAERASELFQPKILTDRTIIDVMAFTNLSPTIKDGTALRFNKLAVSLIQEYDHIFYISPKGIGIEDNGVRVTDSEYRDNIDDEINYIISDYKDLIKNFTILSGTTEERIEQVKQALNL